MVYFLRKICPQSKYRRIATRITARYPEKRIEIDERNVPVFVMEVNASGQPYRGMGVRPSQIQQHKEQWGKIIQALEQVE